MKKPKLIRITTVPLSLEKLLEGQLAYMSDFFEVIAISSEAARLQAYGRQEGVRTKALPLRRKITPFQDIKAIYLLYRFLRKEQPEIVHTHTPKAGWVGMLAAYLAGVPIRIHTVAGMPLMEATGLKRRLLNTVEKWTYRTATHVFPNSKGLLDFIQEQHWTDPEKLKIIGNGSSNGIDTHYFSPHQVSEEVRCSLRSSLGIPETGFVFVFVGRLVGDKGINELITAFDTLSQTQEGLVLLLVGPFESDLDPLHPQTLKTIETHPGIHTTGFVQDVRPYLSMSQVLVFPSYREGFPNVVMQAGAMGLPVIATNINGCNEIIEEGHNGLLIPPKEVLPLQHAMEEVLPPSEAYQVMKQAARSSILNRLERTELWDALFSEYQRLLANI
ncbi:glycosyltransferase family 4 protein [Altibacter sp. HG106]|uniref:glycosyltransferase family 4 protein n=1 Tax=Altibacter sp. HG106 TaxID=3023937 RepID=UPI00234FD21A|nr:glycosyltransferase family 4 protein [Altibacter sp. HG106]MDC7995357.1 glycosyltransferase family 4 protein [Altibacter sp. HG106]